MRSLGNVKFREFPLTALVVVAVKGELSIVARSSNGVSRPLGYWGLYTHSILLYSVCKHQSWIPQSVSTVGFYIAFYSLKKNQNLKSFTSYEESPEEPHLAVRLFLGDLSCLMGIFMAKI